MKLYAYWSGEITEVEDCDPVSNSTTIPYAYYLRRSDELLAYAENKEQALQLMKVDINSSVQHYSSIFHELEAL